MSVETANTDVQKKSNTTDVEAKANGDTSETKVNDTDDVKGLSLTGIVPIKSECDEREYRIITLPNKLECILVSDPKTEKAASSMDVHVGSYADPEDLPGLAHFLEHMLFLGTKKYPDETEYNKYLNDHGGYSNASTGTHHTQFEFEVHSAYLDGALDRFAQFFIAPLFTESATERELNAVNSEHNKNLQRDSRKQYQFHRSLGKKTHPWHKFGTGNLETLKKDKTRNELLKFHKQYYSANIMKLSVIGKESLDKLQEIVLKYFNDIINKNIKPPKYSNDVYDGDKVFKKLFKIYPVTEIRDVNIFWPYKSTYKYCNESVTSLIAYCLGDEGPGSVLSLLKNKGWATELCAGVWHDKEEHCVIGCNISMTIQGYKNWDKIINIVYMYIDKMQKLTDKDIKMYYDERNVVNKISFKYKGKEKPYDYACTLARQMQYNYDRKKILYNTADVFDEMSTDIIKEYFNALTVDNAYYELVCKDVENECDCKEIWYNTPYKTESIDSKLLKSWMNFDKNSKDYALLNTPPPNQYIASNFDIYCDDTKNADEISTVPVVIKDTKQHKVWFKMDDYFKKPKLCVKLRVISPKLIDTVTSRNYTELINEILDDGLAVYTYAFEEANVFYKIFTEDDALIFSFNGYNDKLYKLVETVLKFFSELKISKEKYNINYEKMKRDIESKKKSQPYKHSMAMEAYMLESDTFRPIDIENDFNSNITYEGILKHYKEMFKTIFVETLIYGNINKNTADIYINYIDKYLIKKSQNVYDYKLIKSKRKGLLKLPQKGNEYQLRFKCPNKDEINSCITNKYFYCVDTYKDNAIMKIFTHLIDSPFYDDLRTKKQLGYIVWSYSDNTSSYLNVGVDIQGNKVDPANMDKEIEAFFDSFIDDILNKMDDETFEINKKSVINNLLIKPKTIHAQNKRYWGEMDKYRYQFERRKHMAKEVKKLTKKDVELFYNTYISRKSNKRLKVSIQVHGNKHEIPTNNDDTTKIVYLTPNDVLKMRDKCGYYPFGYK